MRYILEMPHHYHYHYHYIESKAAAFSNPMIHNLKATLILFIDLKREAAFEVNWSSVKVRFDCIKDAV